MHRSFRDKKKSGPVIFLFLLVAGVLAACSSRNTFSEKKTLRILATSDLPVLLEMDVKGSIGGIRDYIVNVKKGTIHPECDHNWKIVVSD